MPAVGQRVAGRAGDVVAGDHAGRLWVGIDRDLYLYHRDTFQRVRRPDGGPVGLVSGIAEDAEHAIWIAVSGPPRLLLRIVGLSVNDEYREIDARRVAVDPAGGLWLGLVSGDVAHFRDGAVDAVYRLAPKNATPVNQLVPQADGSVIAATSYGLVVGSGRGFAVMSSKHGLPCDAVHAAVFDGQGDVWLFMDCALVELSGADLERWRRDSGTVVSPRILDAADGARTGRSPFDGSSRSADGHLWFTNGLQVQRIDPASVSRNTIPPPVHIDEVVADRRRYAPAGVVQLPPRNARSAAGLHGPQLHRTAEGAVPLPARWA